jgi:two-component system, LytTR family, response regulator
MPGMNGFEVLQNLTYMPVVIFTTAFDEYALKAFETNSIDYLLKPIEEDRLQKAMEKLRNSRQGKR